MFNEPRRLELRNSVSLCRHSFSVDLRNHQQNLSIQYCVVCCLMNSCNWVYTIFCRFFYPSLSLYNFIAFIQRALLPVAILHALSLQHFLTWYSFQCFLFPSGTYNSLFEIVVQGTMDCGKRKKERKKKP